MRNKTIEHELLLQKKEHCDICENCRMKLKLLEARYEGQLEFDELFESEFNNKKIAYELVTNQFFRIHNMEFEVDTMLILKSKVVVSTIIKYPADAVCRESLWYLDGVDITGAPFEEHQITMRGVELLTKELNQEVKLEGVVVLMNEKGSLPGEYYQSVYE